MQTTSNDGAASAVQAVAAAGTVSRAASAVPQPHQPSQPHVLTDELKAQLATANQLRRAHLYPRLMQNLMSIEQSMPAHNQSHERVLSLEELAAANRERRNRLRETGYAIP